MQNVQEFRHPAVVETKSQPSPTFSSDWLVCKYLLRSLSQTEGCGVAWKESACKQLLPFSSAKGAGMCFTSLISFVDWRCRFLTGCWADLGSTPNLTALEVRSSSDSCGVCGKVHRLDTLWKRHAPFYLFWVQKLLQCPQHLKRNYYVTYIFRAGTGFWTFETTSTCRIWASPDGHPSKWVGVRDVLLTEEAG